MSVAVRASRASRGIASGATRRLRASVPLSPAGPGRGARGRRRAAAKRARRSRPHGAAYRLERTRLPRCDGRDERRARAGGVCARRLIRGGDLARNARGRAPADATVRNPRAGDGACCHHQADATVRIFAVRNPTRVQHTCSGGARNVLVDRSSCDITRHNARVTITQRGPARAVERSFVSPPSRARVPRLDGMGLMDALSAPSRALTRAMVWWTVDVVLPRPRGARPDHRLLPPPTRPIFHAALFSDASSLNPSFVPPLPPLRRLSSQP